TERNYCITRKELLAIVTAKQQEYDFKMIHRAGKSHTNADALSSVPRPCLVSECRHCHRNEQREETTTAHVRVVRDTDIKSKSLKEQHLADNTIAP
ncbi:hypothetical protein LSAT2_022639, partial [Lamellibrachia satsuma]